MDINIGLKKGERKAIADGLGKVLADTYMLYLKTHGYHWNVTGPMFSALHTLFETQYTELHDAADLIAERIRALGEFAPGNYRTYAKLTSIKESTDDKPPAALAMVKELAEGHEAVVRTARHAFKAADKVGDQPTLDLLTQRMEASEKAAWMLRSHLG
ncbi:MAG: Dps family protein [Rhizomicrobium sp.]|jgi:starvation-inducible DNA-binding protein